MRLEGRLLKSVFRKLNFRSQLSKDFCCHLWPLAYDRAGLIVPPFSSPLVNLFSPVTTSFNAAFGDQELQEVLDARPEALSAGRDVERLDSSRSLVTRLGKEQR